MQFQLQIQILDNGIFSPSAQGVLPGPFASCCTFQIYFTECFEVLSSTSRMLQDHIASGGFLNFFAMTMINSTSNLVTSMSK